MDYDQVAFCDLAPLFELDLGDHLLAAHMQGEGVDMEYAMRVWLKGPFPKGWEHVAKHPYFLMPPLLNLAEMRRAGTWEKFQDGHAAFGMDEQLSLTAATEGRILPLAPKWNLFPGLHISGDQVPDGIVHWCGWPKPWHEGAKVWRPELWESERCSWEHLRMGLWDKPVAVEVEPDDDHGVEELLKRGWKVRLFTGRSGAAAEEGIGLRYPDLEVKAADDLAALGASLCDLEQEQISEGVAERPFAGNRSREERVRFGPWVKALEWLERCDPLPKHVILRGPVAAEDVRRVVELGYGMVCCLRHYEWPSGGPMSRVLEYEALGEIRALNAAEEWFLKCEEKEVGLKLGMAVRSDEGEMALSASSSSKSEDALKVGILVAALGEDRRHLPFFIESVRRNFLRDAKIRFVVFSGSEAPPGEDIHGIRVAVPDEGNGNLARFRWIIEAEEACADFDFLVLMKPQVRVMERIGMDEIFSVGCVACHHSAYEGEARTKIRFEENEQSVAWVGPGEGVSYACGSWQAGSREEFLDAVRTMESWVSEDEENGVRPYWGDESYWNRYCIDFPPQRMLGAEYAWRLDSKAARDSAPKVVVLQAREIPVEKLRRLVRRKSLSILK